MTNLADQMWEAVGHDADGEAADRRLATARVRVAPLLGFLGAAADEPEFDARLALAAERVEAEVYSVSDGDAGLLAQVSAGLRADWRRLAATRTAAAEGPGDDDFNSKNDSPGMAHDADEDVYQDDDGDWRVKGSDQKFDTAQDAEAFVEHQGEATDDTGDGDGLDPDDDEGKPDWIKSSSVAAAARLRLAQAARARSAVTKRADYYDDQDREDPVDQRMYDAAGQVGREHAMAGMPRTYDYPDDRSWTSGYDEAYDGGQADAEHDRRLDRGASLRSVACRKCASGRAVDGVACDYCDGRGSLTPTLAVVKDADGWRQGLVREGVFHPEEHGSARYEDVPSPRATDWSHDPWDEADKAFVPGPTPMVNRADGTELKPTKSITEQRPGRTSVKTAGPYDDNPYAPTNNPYQVTGPGMPGAGGPTPAGGPELPGQYAGEGHVPGTVPAGQVGGQHPVPVDQTRRAAAARARQAFSARPGSVTALVDRMAADVMSTNPGLDAARARDLAEESVRRSVGGSTRATGMVDNDVQGGQGQRVAIDEQPQPEDDLVRPELRKGYYSSGDMVDVHNGLSWKGPFRVNEVAQFGSLDLIPHPPRPDEDQRRAAHGPTWTEPQYVRRRAGESEG